jgi:hypothetical protein
MTEPIITQGNPGTIQGGAKQPWQKPSIREIDVEKTKTGAPVSVTDGTSPSHS